MEYEICSDPFDPRSVLASFLYLPGREPEDAKLELEKIRGKEKDMIHNFTPQEEFDLINQQLRDSQGFDIDFSMFRCIFDTYPAFLDESDIAKEPEIDREYFGRLAMEAVSRYNEKEGTCFEFVVVTKENIYMCRGDLFFITFVVKDPSDDNKTKVFQARVMNDYCREIVHHFCRPKPAQQGTLVRVS